MTKPGTTKAMRERAKKRKAKTEAERVKALEKTDAVERGKVGKAGKAAQKAGAGIPAGKGPSPPLHQQQNPYHKKGV